MLPLAFLLLSLLPFDEVGQFLGILSLPILNHLLDSPLPVPLSIVLLVSLQRIGVLPLDSKELKFRFV